MYFVFSVLVYIQEGWVVTLTVGQQAKHPAQKRQISFRIPLSSSHSRYPAEGGGQKCNIICDIDTHEKITAKFSSGSL